MAVHMPLFNLVRYVLVLVVVLIPQAIVGEHWAVIVAGSKGYDNYRHQADACHAYHVVRRHGIPEENVILMMYDDIAAHHRNPFPGKLFNKPTAQAINGSDKNEPVDVYAGCKVDYRGDDVTPEVFLNVLLGKQLGATEGKKVLNSTSDDRVFVNFVDHGSRGFVYFPETQALSAKELKDTMMEMYAKKMYKELVFYLEACESGSMFSSSFLKKINAFVTTAANSIESSWGTYCPPLDIVNETYVGSCLGDLYSVNWMEDSDRTDLSSETLKQQFLLVKKETNRSHVHEFGSPIIKHEIVGNFQSNYDKSSSVDNDEDGHPSDQAKSMSQRQNPLAASSDVDAHDIDLVVAFYQYLRAAPGPQRRPLAAVLTEKIRARERADALFEHIQALYEETSKQTLRQVDEPEHLDCLEQVFDRFKSHCGAKDEVGHGLTSYGLKYAGMLVDLCESSLDTDAIVALVTRACAKYSLKEPSDPIYQTDLVQLG